MTNCLSGCISKYFCGGLKNAIDSASYAPYVKLKISGEGQEITVGNESCPAYNNSAVIKSMQIGFSDSMGVVFEIHDDQGGNFEYFMDKINKCIGSMTEDYRMEVEYGWIGTDCGSETGSIIKKSPPVYCMPMQINANMSDGKIRFRLTGTSLLEGIFESRASKVYRGTLKSAIQQLFADPEYPPQINSVKFLRRTPDGGTDTWDFEKKFDSPEGPKAAWTADTQNKLAAAMSWLEPYRTDRGKGVRPAWESETSSPTLVFWEDPYPNCGDSNPCGEDSLGTYIVHGGQCSPVLSFDPNAKWPYGALHRSGGNAGSALTAGSVENEGRPGCEDIETKGAGTQTSVPPPQNIMDTIGPKEAAKEMRDSSAQHDHAQMIVEAISAELRIQGDPELSGNTFLMGKKISIVAINPFFIASNGNGCGDWLASPGCQPVYSNKSWIVMGVNHAISEGSYVTTLKVTLPMPGTDIDKDDVFGGPGSAGWKPPTGCRT